MSDKQYLHWLTFQRSCLDGAFGEYVEGRGRNVAAHVRRASRAGIAYKPQFSAVPLTDEQHRYQHQHGELRVIQHFRPDVYKHGMTVEDAKAWFNQQVNYYFLQWGNVNAIHGDI